VKSHRHHRWPICAATGKRRYGERKDAKLALRAASLQRSVAEAYGGICGNLVSRAYRCRHCGGFHLTSQTARNPVAA